METSFEIIDWFSSRVDQLSLQVTQLTWPSVWNLPVHDFEAKIKWQGQVYTGRGTNRSEPRALAAALGECLERLACDHQRLRSSNAVSAHSDRSKAEWNARSELLERDALFCHFFSETPLLSEPNFPQDLLSSEAKSRLLSLGIETHLFWTYPSRNQQTAVIVISGIQAKQPFGIVVGSALKSSREESREHALWEAFRNLANLVDGQKFRSLGLNEFLAQQSWSPKDHDDLALDLAYGSKALQRLAGESSLESPRSKTEIPDTGEIYFTEISLPEELESAPVYIVRAFADHYIDYKLGWPSFSKEEVTRLAQIKNKLDWSPSGFIPHPLG